MEKKLEDGLQQGKLTVVKGIKKNLYDIIAGVTVLAIIVASLQILGLTPWTEHWYEPLIDFGPFFLAAYALGLVMYEKGSFVGKGTNKFRTIADAYSEVVDSVDGKQLKVLPDFCDEFNEKAIEKIQTNMLKKKGISYGFLYNEFEMLGVKHKPLCNMSDKELLELFTDDQASCIRKTLNTEVKGISSEKLLTELEVKDVTELGATESSMKKRNAVRTLFTYLLIGLLFSFIGIKDISQWKWAGLLIVIFKTAYSVVKAYRSYFKGYDDVTINLANHILRKTDILKQFKYWYNEKDFQ